MCSLTRNHKKKKGNVVISSRYSFIRLLILKKKNYLGANRLYLESTICKATSLTNNNLTKNKNDFYKRLIFIIRLS